MDIVELPAETCRACNLLDAKDVTLSFPGGVRRGRAALLVSLIATRNVKIDRWFEQLVELLPEADPSDLTDLCWNDPPPEELAQMTLSQIDDLIQERLFQ